MNYPLPPLRLRVLAPDERSSSGACPHKKLLYFTSGGRRPQEQLGRRPRKILKIETQNPLKHASFYSNFRKFREKFVPKLTLSWQTHFKNFKNAEIWPKYLKFVPKLTLSWQAHFKNFKNAEIWQKYLKFGGNFQNLTIDFNLYFNIFKFVYSHTS